MDSFFYGFSNSNELPQPSTTLLQDKQTGYQIRIFFKFRSKVLYRTGTRASCGKLNPPRGIKWKFLIFFLMLSPILFFSVVLFNPDKVYGQNPDRNNPVVVLKDQKEIRIAGYVQAKKFNKKPLIPFGHTKNWHGIVWEGGTVNKSDILFVSYADDLSVYRALIDLGAVPGNNLTIDTWNKRGKHNHPEPNKKVEGEPINVKISWEGSKKEYSFSELIKDTDEMGISLKFGGHKELIPVWKSGCIVCLYSCPGGKVSNATYTANDYMFNATRFTARENLLPPDGTDVVITISIK